MTTIGLTADCKTCSCWCTSNDDLVRVSLKPLLRYFTNATDKPKCTRIETRANSVLLLHLIKMKQIKGTVKIGAMLNFHTSEAASHLCHSTVSRTDRHDLFISLCSPHLYNWRARRAVNESLRVFVYLPNSWVVIRASVLARRRAEKRNCTEERHFSNCLQRARLQRSALWNQLWLLIKLGQFTWMDHNNSIRTGLHSSQSYYHGHLSFHLKWLCFVNSIDTASTTATLFIKRPCCFL